MNLRRHRTQEFRLRGWQDPLKRRCAELYLDDFPVRVEQPGDEVQFALQACEISIRADRRQTCNESGLGISSPLLASIAARNSRSAEVTHGHYRPGLAPAFDPLQPPHP